MNSTTVFRFLTKQEYQLSLHSSNDERREVQPLQFQQRQDALHWLHEYRYRNNADQQLRSILQLADHYPLVHIFNHNQILLKIADLLVQQRIYILTTEYGSCHQAAPGDDHSVDAGKENTELDEETEDFILAKTPVMRPYDARDSLPQDQDHDTHWIEFVVIDDDSDAPLANIPFLIKLPDGRKHQYFSDKDGRIRIDDIPSGNCDIDDIADSEGLEVIDVIQQR